MNKYVSLQDLDLTMEKLLRKTYRWELHPDGSFIAHMRNGGPDYDEKMCLVSEHDLAILHPQLPISMRAAYDYNVRYDDALGLSGINISNTYKYLRGDMLKLTCTQGNTMHMYSLYHFDYSTTSNQVLVIRGTAVNIDSHNYQDEPVDVITEVYNSHTMVFPAFFDQHYPGWRTRWDFCKTLNMSVDEYLPYLLEKIAAPSDDAQMSGINFE